jgi:stage II sporulation SpoE-like protein/GAF domain-containing protein
MSVRVGIAADSGAGSESALARVSTAADAVARVPDVSETTHTLLASLADATGAVRASLMLVNPATGRLTISAALGLPEHLIGQDVVPRPRSISEWVFRQRRAIVLNGEVQDQRFESYGENTGLIESALSLPLEGASGPIGVVNLARHSPAPVFADDDQTQIAARLPAVASAIARARATAAATRSWTALADGAATRCSMMPLGRLEVRGYELAFARRGSERLCADGVERIAGAGGGQTLLVYDVTGDGSEAAVTAALVQGMFAALAGHVSSVTAIASRISAELFARLGGRRPASLWVGHLTRTGELAYCTAGYPAPRWVPADGSPQIALDRGGPMTGALAEPRYEEERLRLLPGDLVAMVSDGVLEGRSTTDQPFGITRVADVLDEHRRQPVDVLCEAVVEAAIAWSGRPTPVDDAVAFALRYSPGD